MLASQIPVKFPIPFANNAAPQYTNAIPQGSQIGITGGAASLFDGFPPLTFLPVGAGGVPPWGRDFNGLMNQISAWVQYADNAGVSPIFDAAFSSEINGYPQGAILYSVNGSVGNDAVWLSLQDNNTINPDGSFGGSGAWQVFGFVNGIQNQLYTGMPDVGSINALQINPLPPPQAYTTFQRWVVKVANTTTVTNPTLNVTGVNGTATALLGPKTIVFANGSPVPPGVITAGMVLSLVYDGTVFQIENMLPPYVSSSLVANRIYYVNSATGNDTNNGLNATVTGSAGPWATIQHGLSVIQGLALNGFTVSLNVAVGNGYLGPVILPRLSAVGTVYITGAAGLTSGAGACTITCSGTQGGACFMSTVSGVSGYVIGEFKLVSTGTNTHGWPNAGVWMGEGCSVQVYNLQFGACTTAHFDADFGLIQILGADSPTGSGTIWVTGNTGSHWLATDGGIIACDNPSYNIENAVSITTWANVTLAGYCKALINNNGGFGGAGNVTGAKYLVDTLGLLYTGGFGSGNLPGTVGGTNNGNGAIAD